jgi:hypothetical protein
MLPRGECTTLTFSRCAMRYRLKLLDPPETPNDEASPLVLPRVAGLPGAERRILRRRLSQPSKAVRTRPQAARRSG